MSETVRARYMGNKASIRIDAYGDDPGYEVEVEPRHIYELPKNVVAGRDDFIIQEDEPERAVEDIPEKKGKN